MHKALEILSLIWKTINANIKTQGVYTSKQVEQAASLTNHLLTLFNFLTRFISYFPELSLFLGLRGQLLTAVIY